MCDAGHGVLVTIGEEGGVAKLHTGPEGVIRVVSIRATTCLHTPSEVVVLEVVIGAGGDAALGGDVEIEIGSSGVRTDSDAGAVV